MKMEAIIPYKEAYAKYCVTQESEFIYAAVLISYDGGTHDMPPVNITMTKGVRHWIGSTHIQIVIDELGEAIEWNHHLFEAPAKSKDTNALEEGSPL
jgi:hypothetical protein